MSLSAEKIQTIKDRVDPLEIIGRAVVLRKRGRGYVGLCPFHEEKTPSFSVSAEKGVFYCFGCHAHGDVISFVMQLEGLDFQGAVERIAAAAGIPLGSASPEVAAQRQARQNILDVNHRAAAFFTDALWSSRGASCRHYLRDRGIPESQARRRKLGFGGAPGAFVKAMTNAGIGRDMLAKAGLLTEERALFDGRLIFPITDDRGALVGFGGRRLLDVGPKYINTKESPLFAKRRLLFGWHEARFAIRQRRRVILVEGYTDVLACERAGLPEAVAALGTAFGTEHADMCARLADVVVLFFDGDAAGIKAVRGASEKLLRTGLKTLVAAIPQGVDPDALLRQGGAKAMQDALHAAKPALEVFIEAAFATANMTIEDRSRAIVDLAPLLTALPSGLERELYHERLAQRAGVTLTQLQRCLPRSSADQSAHVPHARPPQRRAPQPDPAPAEAKEHPDSLDGLELEMLRELLLYPRLRPRLGDIAEYAITKPMRCLLDEMAQSTETTEMLLASHIHNRDWVQRLQRIRPAVVEDDDDGESRAERTFLHVLLRLKRRHVDTALRELLHKIKEIELSGGDPSPLMQRKRSLAQRKRALGREAACLPS